MATQNNQTTGWVGWIYFAAFLLMAVGIFQAIIGFTALLNDNAFVKLDGTLLLFDFTTWGWIHLILGIVTLIVGTGLVNGSGWARVLAALLVVVHFVAQFAFLPVYPVWSLVIMVLDIVILYALTVHGDEVRYDR